MWDLIWTEDVQKAVWGIVATIIATIALSLRGAVKAWLQALEERALAETESHLGIRARMVATDLVTAAEQWAKREGGKAGSDKLAQAIAWANSQGVAVSIADIEAAVARVKAQQGAASCAAAPATTPVVGQTAELRPSEGIAATIAEAVKSAVVDAVSEALGKVAQPPTTEAPAPTDQGGA